MTRRRTVDSRRRLAARTRLAQRHGDALLSAPWIPAFIVDIVADRRALLGLVAACLAMAAAGLDPHILDAGSVRGQAMLASDPRLEAVITVAALAQAGLILIGGAVADIWRSERLLGLALLGLVIASFGAVLWPSGLGLVGSRFLAWACVGIIVPFAVGVVAILYTGVARATALGALFGIYGATTAIAPFLVTVFGADGPEIQAFALAAVAAIVAFWAVGRWLPDLPGALASQRRLVVTTVVWAFGVIAAALGLMLDALDLAAVGLVFVGAAVVIRRMGRPIDEAGVAGRSVSAALIAGLVTGFSQAIPLIALPQFFTNIQRFPSLVATILIAPFAIGLLVSGPLAGFLLERFRPRFLLIGGVWAIALADLAFVVLLHPSSGYLWFVLPLALVGAGFVIANVIRTAVVFASTPRHLPATAAALNESSIGLGARLGATGVILVRTNLDFFGIDELTALRAILLISVIIAVIGGVVVSVLLGPRDPLGSVWDLREEREGATDLSS